MPMTPPSAFLRVGRSTLFMSRPPLALEQTAPVRVVVAPTRAQLADLSLSPGRVQAGETTTGTVTLSAAAPGKVVVDLATESRWVRLPKQVAIPAGSVRAQFTVATSSKLRSALPVVISATLGSVTKTVSLTIEGNAAPVAVALASLSVSPTTARGGNAVSGTVVLSGNAPADTPISLTAIRRTSDGKWARVECPKSVVVPRGRRQAAFAFTVPAVSARSPVTVAATYAGVTQTANLTAEPAQ